LWKIFVVSAVRSAPINACDVDGKTLTYQPYIQIEGMLLDSTFEVSFEGLFDKVRYFAVA